MIRWRAAVVVSLWATQGCGWWHPALEPMEDEPPRFQEDPAGYVRWWSNSTINQAHWLFKEWRPGTWDGLVWSILDTILSGFGWMIFGQNWASVRSGCSLVIRLGALMALCLLTHYVLSLCWPLCSLFIGTLLTIIWVLRGLIVKVVDSSSIKTNGIFLTIEPEATRGDAALLLALQGCDKVHLCRHDSCQEEGQHFKLYALASELNAEHFHLATSAKDAKRAGSRIFAWMRRGASTTAKRLKDYTSESEYAQLRASQKCSIMGCYKLGYVTKQGKLPPAGEEADEPEDGEGDAGLRRRVRPRGVSYDVEEAENTLKEVRAEEDRTATRRRTTASPGHTPKSSVQHNLARLGMINSPDRKGLASILEEFMEQLVDGKTLGLEEEDIRKQMAAQYGMTLVDLTKQLFEQATEEQRKGTKGLTKFLAKWRKQAAARESSSSDSWCVVTPSQSPGASTAPRSETATPESVKEEVPRSRKPPGLVTLAPPGIYDPDRKAGTGEEQQPQSEMVGIAKAIQQQTNELASLVKAQQESTMAPGGSVKSLGRTSEELVYLLRACEQYTVQVGGGEYGAALASALLAAQAGASTKLRNAGFRQKVTTRLAVGLAGPHWGTQEKYALSAADFTPSTDAELDQFAIESRTGKVLTEQRPAAPTRYEDWISRVRRQNDIWALVYGAEWKNVKDHAANLLSEWHLGAPHRWPLQVLCDVWEELHWRFIEELKEELRKIKKLAGRESMTLQDLKFYALMPNEQGEPPLQLPRTFDLKNPDGWFMTEVLPRIERRQERMLWKMTWEGAGKNRSQGQSAGGDGGAPKGEKTGLSLKNLFGPKLTPEETNKAKDRAPTNKDGKLLCWGFLTHLGCNQTNCQRAHEQLKGTFEALDPAVQMQLLRRGGLKRMRPETKDSVVEKIKALRNQVSQDRTSKVQDGKDRRRAGQEGERETQESSPEKAGGHRVHWEAPEEMRNVDFTAQEQEFAEMVRGPDENIFQHVEREALPHPGRGGESGPWEAQELIRKAQQLADGPVLGALKEASDDLYAWAATRVANDPAVGLQELLEEMNQFDLGELAAEAAAILDKQDGGEKAGHAGRCQVGESTWDSSGVGRALVHVDGTAWAMWDFGEMVEMTEELAGLLGVLEAEPEKRQCVTKVLAAGSLWAKTSKVPSMEEVEITAKQFRLEQARLAADAEGVMGHPEAKVAPVEHELRMYSHDILKAHHDKDYRALAVFPLNDLDHLRLVVLRVDYKGDLLVETVTGSQWTEQQPDVWALICRGHMTLLVPPDPAEARKLILKEEAYNTPSFGFRYFWHQRHDQPRTSPGILACRLCKPGRKGGSKEPYGMVRKTSCLPALARVLAGSPQPARPVPPAAGRQGLVLREYFAGHGVITKGWQEAGLTALEPVELYQDPHQQLGPRQEHDLSVKENQSKYLQGIQQDETNVEWIAAPCTTFCDWALQNGGHSHLRQTRGITHAKRASGQRAVGLWRASLRSGHAARTFPHCRELWTLRPIP
ncbi:unnamed protein product [Durusdinium trenchii]|uniref:Uncharacterized protein n=1 Tax=Durusdinium trenchii TaxID=1381693 RepID=A0ABP0T2U3_9DINO